MNRKLIIKIVIAFILAFIAVIFGLRNKNSSSDTAVFAETTENLSATPQTEEVPMNLNTEPIRAIKNSTPLKYVLVKNAHVIKTLPDDKNGPLHQRWIMEIENGITITVFHNVDIAERVPVIVGSRLTVAGELEYGDKWKDPIMHWTHDDPQNRRQAGYVLFNGERFGHATGP